MPKDVMRKKPQLTDNTFISFDGTELPLRIWLPAEPLKAVFIAVHGYNDYSAFIMSSALCFNNRNIALYAYDQRGFGKTENPGRWVGYKTMVRDLKTFIPLVQKRHPDIPLYLLGHSMGGAVIMTAAVTGDHLPCTGVVLVAPAVWSRTTMPFYQRWALALAVRLVPWFKASPEGLDIAASDNKKMLEELANDPLFQKRSRIDSLYGLSNLMDAAYASSSSYDQKTLFLYGSKDEIIPAEPVADVFRVRLRGSFTEPQRILYYKNGYHMLLRDLQADTVREDILFWIDSPAGTFPSVHSKASREITTEGDIKKNLAP